MEPDLTHRLSHKRNIQGIFFTLITWLLAAIGSIPLFSIVFMLITNGSTRLDLEGLTSLPPTAFETGGGFGNAIVGTFLMVGIAAAISIPIGVLTAIYFVIVGPQNQITNISRFTAKVLTGFPSILAGVFVYTLLVINFGYSALAGGISLVIIMLPIVILTAEEAMKQVPQSTIDAAYGMGCTQTQVVLKVVLPMGLPGILTGVILAVARSAGESAPLLLTALFSNYYFSQVMEPTASLSILIYNFSSVPFENQTNLAWTASLVLVFITLTFNILARLIKRSSP